MIKEQSVHFNNIENVPITSNRRNRKQSSLLTRIDETLEQLKVGQSIVINKGLYKESTIRNYASLTSKIHSRIRCNNTFYSCTVEEINVKKKIYDLRIGRII
jgi:MinD superfamily P-loop ATPase